MMMMAVRPRSFDRRPHRRAPFGMLVLALTALMAACATAPEPPQAAPVPSPTHAEVEQGDPAPSSAPPREPALSVGVEPVAVRVDSIGVEADLIDLGLAPDGTMEVPVDFDDVGWFAPGGRPGGIGPTVIAAHVDSPTGPAAFFRLREVAVGEEIVVVDESGTEHSYTVTELQTHEKEAFPTAEVFGASAQDELRLITCTGDFDPTLASYRSNLIVFAERSA